MVFEDSKYEQVNNFECQKCPNPVLNGLRVCGVLLLVFGFFLVLIFINVNKTKESELSILFRIMTNYLQLITTSMSLSSGYPDSLTNVFIPANRIGGSSEAFLSFD